MPMKKLHLTVSDREIRSGFLLLITVFFCLPYLLSALNEQLITPVDTATLNLIYHTVNFIGGFTVFRSFVKNSVQQLSKHFKSILSYTVIGTLIYFGLAIMLSRFILWLKPDFINLNDHNIAMQLESQWVFVIIGTIFMGPLTEELMFRGHVFGYLYNKYPATAYIISMCAFSLVHILGYVGTTDMTTLFLSFIQYLPAGGILAWVYAQSGSIFTPVIVHTFINAIGIYTMR